MDISASIPLENPAFSGIVRRFKFMPRFSPEINFGHMLTAATILVSGAVLYGTQAAGIETQKEWLKRHDAMLDKHAVNLSELNAHATGTDKMIANFEAQFKRLEDANKDLSKDVKEILKHTSEK